MAGREATILNPDDPKLSSYDSFVRAVVAGLRRDCVDVRSFQGKSYRSMRTVLRCLFDPAGVRGGWGLFVGCPNSARSVLSCIEADFWKERLILQHVLRSTRFANFCTAPNLEVAVVHIISQMFGEIIFRICKFH